MFQFKSGNGGNSTEKPEWRHYDAMKAVLKRDGTVIDESLHESSLAEDELEIMTSTPVSTKRVHILFIIILFIIAILMPLLFFKNYSVGLKFGRI